MLVYEYYISTLQSFHFTIRQFYRVSANFRKLRVGLSIKKNITKMYRRPKNWKNWRKRRWKKKQKIKKDSTYLSKCGWNLNVKQLLFNNFSFLWYLSCHNKSSETIRWICVRAKFNIKIAVSSKCIVRREWMRECIFNGFG